MSETSKQMRAEWSVNDAKRDAGLTTPETVERFDDLLYGPDAVWNRLDVYRPKKERGNRLPVIVSIHGGGWVYGDKELYQFYCMSLAERGFAVVNFTYRLAPESKFPAQLEDANLVMRWVHENSETYLFDLDNIFMVGDSAGAHLLGLYTAVCTCPEYAARYEFKAPEGFVPRALGLNCGAYEPLSGDAHEGEGMNRDLMGDLLPEKGSERERRLVNVTEHVNGSWPPVYLMTAVGDFCLDQAPKLKEKLVEAGVPCEYHVYGDREHPLYHVFHLTVQEAEGRQCNDQECEFFRRMMKRGGSAE